MIGRIFTSALVIALAFVFSSAAFGQEAPKKEMKKEDKRVYKTVTCSPECGFMVRSHDDKELTEIVKSHAKKMHNKDLTDKDVMSMAKTEGAPEPKPEMKKEEPKKEEKKY